MLSSRPIQPMLRTIEHVVDVLDRMNVDEVTFCSKLLTQLFKLVWIF